MLARDLVEVRDTILPDMEEVRYGQRLSMARRSLVFYSDWPSRSIEQPNYICLRKNNAP
jgi:hypothetical protein